MTTSDIARSVPMINSADLREINSFEAALALAKNTYGELAIASEELGDGFALTDNKDQFIKVPIVLVHWTFAASDFVNKETGEKGEFAVCRVVTKSGGKFVIIDGGFGIYQQLRDFTDSHDGRTGGLVVERGLRKYDGESEEFGSFARYYLDTASV